MRTLSQLAIVFTACIAAAHAQIGRTLDWPTFGNDAGRSGWEKSDSRFTKDDIAKGFQLLWKFKPDPKSAPKYTPPVLVGTLVGSRGFKELAFIGGSNDSLYSFDVDLNRVYWQRQLIESASVARRASGECPGGMTSTPTLFPIAVRRPAPRPAPGAAPAPAPSGPPPRTGIFSPRAVYLISSDGKLRRVNVDSGKDASEPYQVVPAGAKTSTLNVFDGTIYTTTSNGCGGAPNAVWAIDLGNLDPSVTPKVKTFSSTVGNFVGAAGTAIGTDGTIYAQGENGLIALTPKELTLKGTYNFNSADVTPVVFQHEEKEHIVVAGKDGKLTLLDSSLAVVAQTAEAGGTITGSLSTWAEQDGARWILAPVWSSKGGVIKAYRLETAGGKPSLTNVWTSRDLVKPVAPVISSGAVFALSNGEGARGHATLYALDANTGKELWSTGNQVTAPGSMTGLTVANGRVFFSTTDGTFWAFGMPLEW